MVQMMLQVLGSTELPATALTHGRRGAQRTQGSTQSVRRAQPAAVHRDTCAPFSQMQPSYA